MNIPLFDAHCDTAQQLVLRGYGLYENGGHTDLKRGLEYSPYAQFYALFAIDEKDMPVRFPHLSGKTATEIFELELSKMLSELNKNAGSTVLCKTAHEAEKAQEQGKAAAFLSIEGAELIGCDLKKLREMHALGVRALNFTWNNPNSLVYEKGLTDLGREFVKCCNELGVIIDVSHISDAAFWDVLKLTKDPIMASHSNSRTIWNNRRNLTDEQFRAIIHNDGVAGINFYAYFLGAKPGIDAIVRHIEHFLSLGGEKNIAIGSDFDGCDPLAEEICGIEDIKRVYNTLLRLNYSESLVKDIFYNNLRRVVKRVCDT